MDQSSVTSGAETLKKREREQEDDEEEIDEVEQKKLDDAFLDACKNGTLDDVKRTLRAGAFIIAQNRNGNTGLNLVVRREEQEIVFEIVKFLLSKRCHPSITNEEGENAVHLAADFASADVMKLLLAKDRHLAALSDRSGWTPLSQKRLWKLQGCCWMQVLTSSKGLSTGLLFCLHARMATLNWCHFCCREELMLMLPTRMVGLVCTGLAGTEPSEEK